MRYLFLDFESYYDELYTLRKMTPLEYALDPRFEALGCGFADMEGRSWWVDGPDLPMHFASIDWSEIYAVSHNALFDMVLLSFRYGVHPKMYGCTLSMARNQLAHKLRSLSLESICEEYGMPPKMQTVHKMRGVNFHQLSQDPVLHAEVRTYGADDAEKCREVFARLIAGGFPPGELDIIDLVIRMAARPQLELDEFVLAEHLAQVQAQKQQLLDEIGPDTDNIKLQLMSDKLLAIVLWNIGVKQLPMKISRITGQEQYAFAKTDKAFTDLLEHPNPRVQAYVAARLGHKSTLEETRTQRLLSISQATKFTPVPLKYSGAHTHRFSGDWRINLQNLPNDSSIRKALKAPKGKVVVSIDASQIEARLNAELAGQDDLVEDFRKGVDVYSKFAAEEIYLYPVSKANKVERFVGKTGILSLGYGASPPVFQNMCRVKGGIKLLDSEAAFIVDAYRQRFKKIVENWKYASELLIRHLAVGNPRWLSAIGFGSDVIKWGPLEIRHGCIVLPNGNRLYYPDLRQVKTENGITRWVLERAGMSVHLYGAKLVENVVQALAFVHIMAVANTIYELTEGLLWPAHQVHDELIYVVDEPLAEQVAELVVQEMSTPPLWMPTLPLAAEAHIGPTYGDLK